MDRNEAKAFIKKQSPKSFLEMDGQNKGCVCPFCGNGSGKKGDGLRKIPNSDTYKCFSCDKAADIFDLIGAKFSLTDFNEQLAKAAEIYGIDIEKHTDSSKSNPTHATPVKTSYKPKDSDMSDYIEKCHKAVSGTTFYQDRGISEEMIDRFNLGYDPSCTESVGAGNSWKAAIIPTSNYSYEIRNTEVGPNDAEKGSNKYRKHGGAVLFNGTALTTEKDKPIFVCEGVLDAISIIQSGGQAIALGSVTNYKALLVELDKITPSKPLILVLDNDIAGNKATEKLERELNSRNISYMCSLDVIGNDYHDPNDRLIKDKEGLIEAIRDAEEKSSLIKSPAENAKEEYIHSSVSQSIGAFKSMISASSSRPRLSTGFRGIDDSLDGGLYTGLYIIGAISSLGKTTLALQIADNLVQQGKDVLFFSLEQSKFELMSKSVSRETYIYCQANNIDSKNAKSSLGISDGRRYAKYNDTEKEVITNAFSKYESYSEHLFIYEGIGNISVSEIRNKVKDHISYTGNKRPIVFIDYLQILAASEGDERATDKQVVDHNVTALKQLSRDFDIPVFAVSSLNRENYKSEINMAAFKESGAIEYGSDVLIGLQLKGAGDKDFDVNGAKSKDPREVEFCILKYRNGRITSNGIEMHYYPKFNYFECVSDKGITTTITPEQADRIPTDIKPIFDPDKLVFFDVEVFPNLFVVNYMVQGEDVVTRLINPTVDQIRDLVTAKLVGFNCRKYDNHILYGWMQGLDNKGLYQLSQRIVKGDNKAFYKEAYNLSYTDVYDFASTKQSLKKWEIELGIHHQELGLSWDEPVPEDMWDKVAEYCDNDVIATEKVFDHLKGDFTARLILAELAGMTPNDTTNSLTTRIIFGNNKHPQDHFNYRDLSKVSGDGKPQFDGYTFGFDEDGNVKSLYKGYEVGEGGFVWSKAGMYERTVTFDVASMHPSSVIAENLFGDEYTSRFKELLDARLCIKHKDFDKAKTMLNGVLAKYLDDESQAKALAQALKIAINSVYGLTCAKFDNPFRDPRNKDNIVAKRGALFMINLKEEVEARGGEVIHIKTDSIKVVNPSKELANFIIEYGKEYGYNFEIEHIFEKICLVDKAQYIAKLDKDDPDEPEQWTATGAQFKVPYIFKTLFTGEKTTLEDMSETKSVTSAIYLDLNEGLSDEEHNYQFVGKVGAFCPIKAGKGGGVLVKDNEKGGYSAVTGTKNFRWLETETVKTFSRESDIDTEYYNALVHNAIETIEKFGNAAEFIPYYQEFLSSNNNM